MHVCPWCSTALSPAGAPKCPEDKVRTLSLVFSESDLVATSHCVRPHFSHPPTHTTLTPNMYIPHIHTHVHSIIHHTHAHTPDIPPVHAPHNMHTSHSPLTPHMCAHRFSHKGCLFTKHALPEEVSQLLGTQPGVLFLAFSELKFSQCCMTQLTRQPFLDTSSGPCPVRGSGPLVLCGALFSARL